MKQRRVVYVLPIVCIATIGLVRLAVSASAPVGAPAQTAPTDQKPTSDAPLKVVGTVTANNQWTPQTQTFDGVDMMLVPPGCFMMGSTSQEISDLNKQGNTYFFSGQGPQTSICFDKPFWIDKTDVTQAQFKRFKGIAGRSSRFSGDNRPVESITWFEARDFCVTRGARLPTEAEWEYAARGPDDLLYPWGDTWDDSKVVWGRPISQGTADVGSLPAGGSWVGALDMSGNVWQWTSSIYKPYPYEADDGRESSSDTSSPRVLRGGSGNLIYFVSNLHAANRLYNFPSFEYYTFGFRCARSA